MPRDEYRQPLMFTVGNRRENNSQRILKPRYIFHGFRLAISAACWSSIRVANSSSNFVRNAELAGWARLRPSATTISELGLNIVVSCSVEDVIAFFADV
jgi:hypothetical protein